MRNKLFLLSISSFLFVSSLAGCAQNPVTSLHFEQSEYFIHSGDKVTVKESASGITYTFVDNKLDNVHLNSSTGEITYSDVPNSTQVLYTATLGNVKADPVVVNLMSEVEVPTLTFVETTDYICDGNYIYATSSTNSSILYELKQRVDGVHINNSTGQVTFTDTAVEGNKFTVVISSNGASQEKQFTICKTHLVKPVNLRQATEADDRTALCFYLDFSDIDISGDHQVTRLITGRHVLGTDSFVFNKNTSRLTIKKEAISTFAVGENILTIVTNKNMVNVTVIIADKIIKTAEELAAINDSQKALSGYYVLGNDIDLTEYLSPTGKGYDDGQGWIPIGLYHDVTDGTAFNDTFKGTFDGNGHVISGFKMDRRDVYGFNAGIFGYIYNVATIKNLGVTSDYDNKVASFAGSLAGFNEGTISNCWADVNISDNYGGNNYRIIGGLVGRNSGTIENSIALGVVDGESQIGAFVGLNEGTIINCYASKDGYSEFTTGLAAIDSYLLENKNEMLASSGNYHLDEERWDLTGAGYPTVKGDLDFYFPYKLQIENTEFDYVKGDDIEIGLKIYPEALEAEYMDKVTLTVDDNTCQVVGNTIKTTASSKGQIKVSAIIDDDGLYLSHEVNFNLYNATESIEIINNFFNETVEPGENYVLQATVSPAGANQNPKWTMEPQVKGITISGNIMSLTEDVSNEETETFVLKATSGGLSTSLELRIASLNYLSSPSVTTYLDDTVDLEYNIPSGESLANAKLYFFGEQINYTTEGNKLIISRSLVVNHPNEDVGFRLLLASGDVYRLYATYINHNRASVNNLPADAIALSSAADFDTYFNIKTFGLNKYNNYYDKTFYLTADIDFNNEEIYGIGYESEEAGEIRPFTGQIFGFGHTIKNFRIEDNEKYLTLTSSQKEYNFRTSKYVVGFFGSFSGECYDLYFDNATINANSWIGAFAGVINSGAIVENVSFTNTTITNAEGLDYTKGNVVTGRFAGRNNGSALGISYNGSRVGLIGA